jgi:hypothetical protein
LRVRLKDGRLLEADAAVFKGMPEDPLNAAEARAKFLRLAGEAHAGLLATLEDLEQRAAPLTL